MGSRALLPVGRVQSLFDRLNRENGASLIIFSSSLYVAALVRPSCAPNEQISSGPDISTARRESVRSGYHLMEKVAGADSRTDNGRVRRPRHPKKKKKNM
jgi:hypothetical protein